VVKPDPKRQIVNYFKAKYPVSERRACRMAGISRTIYSYKSHRNPHTALRMRMRELAVARARYGYRKITVLLHREGFPQSMKVIYRIYREEGLSLRYRSRRRSKAQATRPQRICRRPDEAWSMDFVSDQLANGSRFRCLTILDVFTRECMAIEVGRQLKGTDVVAVLSKLRLANRTPTKVFVDNGSEFTSQIMDLWA
jgi:putative transposase